MVDHAQLTACNQSLCKEDLREKPNLRLLGTTTVQARATPFIASDYFKVAMGKTDKVKISFVGGNFIKRFLSGAGKIEAADVRHVLYHYELTKRVRDSVIIVELGGESATESTLSDIWLKIKSQGRGNKGSLLAHDYESNTYYVRDVANELAAVDLYWRGEGWGINAARTSLLNDRSVGYRFFARKPIPSTV
jgi:hypothetical protein